MQYLNFNCPFEFKFVGGDGAFEGYASVFNVVDKVGDKILRGAFRKSLAAFADEGNLPPLLWQHNTSEPIGRWTEMYEDDHGLFVKGELFVGEIALAREALKLMEARVVTGLSIGYKVVSSYKEKQDGTRVLTQVDLHEVSLVTFPANDYARVSKIKKPFAGSANNNIPTEREVEVALRSAGLSRRQAKSVITLGYKGLRAMENGGGAEREYAVSVKSLANKIWHENAGILADIINRSSAEIMDELKFNQNQPRVPAGNSDGGQWTAGLDGSSDESKLPERRQTTMQSSNVSLPARRPSYPKTTNARLKQPKDYHAEKRARAIYGETSGLKPKPNVSGANPYNSDNWDESSVQELEKARAYIGIVSERNPRVHFKEPPSSGNRIEESAWNDAVEAADAKENYHLDERVTNFYLRQEGIGSQRPESWPDTLQIIESVGPFANVGGGDVPKGENTYIDFYGKIK